MDPIATRPLFTTGSGNRKFFYTCDGNKNVSELVHFETRNGIAAHYDYAPFGAVIRAISASTITDNTFTTDNPFRFSSEYHDDTLGLVYYNYRHYNPTDGRWCERDPIEETGGINVYHFIQNNPLFLNDSRGLIVIAVDYANRFNIMAFNKNKQSVDAHLEKINEFTDDSFQLMVKAKQVTIDGEPFAGSKEEYITQVKREADSKCIVINTLPTFNQFKDTISQYAKELKTGNDILVVGLHGVVPPNPKPLQPSVGFASNNEFWDEHEYIYTKDVNDFLTELNRDSNGRIALISCYQSQPTGMAETNAYTEGAYFMWAYGKIKKGKDCCEISFSRMRVKRVFGRGLMDHAEIRWNCK